MRALYVIVRKNAETAGGEAGHAALDHDYPLALDIAAAVGDDTVGSAFRRGLLARHLGGLGPCSRT